MIAIAMPQGLLVRPSTACDVAAITALYAHEVSHGVATYEYVAPDQVEMMRRWQATVVQGYPYVVAEYEDRFAGYAYASSFRAREGYRWTVEDTVYVEAGMRGLGVGRALLRRLIDECTGLGYRQMVAVIGDRSNAASIALHRKLDFHEAGVLAGIGRKQGRWLDAVVMQRALGEGATSATGDPT